MSEAVGRFDSDVEAARRQHNGRAAVIMLQSTIAFAAAGQAIRDPMSSGGGQEDSGGYSVLPPAREFGAYSYDGHEFRNAREGFQARVGRLVVGYLRDSERAGYVPELVGVLERLKPKEKAWLLRTAIDGDPRLGVSSLEEHSQGRLVPKDGELFFYPGELQVPTGQRPSGREGRPHLRLVKPGVEDTAPDIPAVPAHVPVLAAPITSVRPRLQPEQPEQLEEPKPEYVELQEAIIRVMGRDGERVLSLRAKDQAALVRKVDGALGRFAGRKRSLLGWLKRAEGVKDKAEEDAHYAIAKLYEDVRGNTVSREERLRMIDEALSVVNPRDGKPFARPTFYRDGWLVGFWPTAAQDRLGTTS